MSYIPKICPYCEASLDPEEHCDCRDESKDTQNGNQPEVKLQHGREVIWQESE